MVLLNSSILKGICYVETKNLDGETNLKHKKPAKECAQMAVDDEAVQSNFNGSWIECEKPNEFIYKFSGCLRIPDKSQEDLGPSRNSKVRGFGRDLSRVSQRMNTIMLDEDMLLLRGSSLRNTDWVYGVAIYTGHDTKVMMNSM